MGSRSVSLAGSSGRPARRRADRVRRSAGCGPCTTRDRPDCPPPRRPAADRRRARSCQWRGRGARRRRGRPESRARGRSARGWPRPLGAGPPPARLRAVASPVRPVLRGGDPARGGAGADDLQGGPVAGQPDVFRVLQGLDPARRRGEDERAVRRGDLRAVARSPGRGSAPRERADQERRERTLHGRSSGSSRSISRSTSKRSDAAGSSSR